MSKRIVKPGPMIYPLPPVMVTCGNMKNSNIITVGWTGIINTKPPMTYISVKKSRFSHKIIKENMEFVINLTTREITKMTDFCGVKSGADIDKFAKTGLTKEKAEIVKAPLIKESPVNIECEVKEIKELPSHDMFIAEIISVHINEDMITSSGKYDFGKMNLTAFNHGAYYTLESKPIGTFGFSVMKSKTLKRKKREELKKEKSLNKKKHNKFVKNKRRK